MPSDGGADAVVVGAGVIGLAVARALAEAGAEVVVLEGERAIGTHTSSRNSEVIHAGIYYPTGSAKARLCVAGRRALYAYAADRGIAHRRVGKLIVATTGAEEAALAQYLERARANGVEDLQLLDAAAAARLEPEVRCTAALFSPVTGIIDAHGLMTALRHDAEAAGAAVVLRAPVVAARLEDGGGATVEVGGPAPASIRCRWLINAAGLWAQQVTGSMAGFPAAAIPPAHYAKGHYFTLAGPSPFRHLVYPVAVAGGLGIHVTLDLGGAARFGPDVAWVDGVDYRFDEGRAPLFEEAIRRYWPGLAPGRLRPGYTGVRPKLGPAGSVAQDFVIQGPGEHGVPGVVNLFGIESPGLTACLALAAEVLARLGR
jgi:L-2-hydroxyglutarate oxidase LhgO